MNILQNKTTWVIAALVSLMAMTRYSHFGSALTLPDASYAVFFLGGLLLGRMRGALAIFAVLLIGASLVDFYAINFLNVSAWCVTSAYGFLVLAYAGLWFVGRWYAPRHNLTGKGLSGLFAAAAVAGSLAFVISNVSFYLLAGYFENMGAVEYASRVTQYYGSYIGAALMYIGCAIVVQMVYAMLTGKVQSDTKAV